MTAFEVVQIIFMLSSLVGLCYIIFKDKSKK